MDKFCCDYDVTNASIDSISSMGAAYAANIAQPWMQMATCLSPRWLSLNVDFDSSPNAATGQGFGGYSTVTPPGSGVTQTLTQACDSSAVHPHQSSQAQLSPGRLVGVSPLPMQHGNPFLLSETSSSILSTGTILLGQPCGQHPQLGAPSLGECPSAEFRSGHAVLPGSPFDCLARSPRAPALRSQSVNDLVSDKSIHGETRGYCLASSQQCIPRNMSVETIASVGGGGGGEHALPLGILRSIPIAESPTVPLKGMLVAAQDVGSLESDHIATHAANATAEAHRAAEKALLDAEKLDVSTIDIAHLLQSFEDPTAGSLPEFAAEALEYSEFDADLQGLFDSFVNEDAQLALTSATLLTPSDNNVCHNVSVHTAACAAAAQQLQIESVFSGVPVIDLDGSRAAKNGNNEKHGRRIGSIFQPPSKQQQSDDTLGSHPFTGIAIAESGSINDFIQKPKRKKTKTEDGTRLEAAAAAAAVPHPSTPEQQTSSHLTRALFNPALISQRKAATPSTVDHMTLTANLSPLGRAGVPRCATSCSFLFTKCLTKSDISRYGRIILPRVAVETYFPPCEERGGLPLELFSVKGECFPCLLRFWLNGPRPNPKKMYLLENCTVLSDTFGMAEGDKLDFYRAPDGRIVLDVHRRSS